MAYQIRAGDTLWSLYGSNWKTVAEQNGITDPTKLQIGQEIITEQTLGSTNYVQSQYFTLYGAGCSSGATSVVLKSFKQIDGTLLTMADFGTKGFGTIEPNNGTQEDQITFTGVTQNANGTATLTGVKWALDVSPYTETAGVRVTHPGGVKFVISNTSAFYNTLTNKSNNETITGTWTYNIRPNYIADTDTANATDFITFGQLSRQAISGAANASTVVKGIVQIPTATQIASSTAVGSTGALLVVPASQTTSSPYTGIGAGVVPATQNNGKISDSFTDFSINKTYTGLNSFTTTTIVSSTIDNLNIGTKSVNTLVNNQDATGYHYHSGNCSFGILDHTFGNTGSYPVNHNLGVTPSFLRIEATATSSISGFDLNTSVGYATSTNSYDTAFTSFGINSTLASSKSCLGSTRNYILVLQSSTNCAAAGGSNYDTATLDSWNNTTFTLNWSNSSLSTLNTYRVHWMACK